MTLDSPCRNKPAACTVIDLASLSSDGRLVDYRTGKPRPAGDEFRDLLRIEGGTTMTTIDDFGDVRTHPRLSSLNPNCDLGCSPIVSVDDHLVEPPETFEGRMPKKFEDAGPRVTEIGGAHVWKVEDRLIPNSGTNAVVGRPPNEYSFEPTHFDQMRKEAYDVDARVQGMDLAGVWSSVCFPLAVCGFGGARFSEAKDPELGLAAVRAWND
jgi:hypothetical protein